MINFLYLQIQSYIMVNIRRLLYKKISFEKSIDTDFFTVGTWV